MKEENVLEKSIREGFEAAKEDNFINPDRLLDTVSAINKRRREDDARRKAEVYRAQEAADEARAIYEYTKFHSGALAIQNDRVMWDCEANWVMIRDWVAKLPDKRLSRANLESAYNALKDSLATAPAEPYQRRTNTQQSQGVEQQQVMPPYSGPLQYSRAEILSWPKERLRKEMRDPIRTAQLNDILRKG